MTLLLLPQGFPFLANLFKTSGTSQVPRNLHLANDWPVSDLARLIAYAFS